jgi:hypothetical protein
LGISDRGLDDSLGEEDVLAVDAQEEDASGVVDSFFVGANDGATFSGFAISCANGHLRQ